ncbi:MAG: hypothetical protein HXM94_00400 [Parvimonas micra]|uniref:Uncharacterized protein n=1 Tax=Parvimonas micra TaxID=33033 RepID=A0A930H5E7_9FIRM|nr:hypothetical protein [Parvimonas micra]MBF1306233.1 hypothetical protein [Parvimonas micra]
MTFIKERGNEDFRIGYNPFMKEEFQILVGNGLIKEVNNCLFIYNNKTELWCLVNSDWHFLYLPKNGLTSNGRLWNITGMKKKMFSKKKKPAMIPARNVIELSKDQVANLLYQIAEKDLSFYQVYERLKGQLNLPEYILPDKEE